MYFLDENEKKKKKKAGGAEFITLAKQKKGEGERRGGLNL